MNFMKMNSNDTTLLRWTDLLLRADKVWATVGSRINTFLSAIPYIMGGAGWQIFMSGSVGEGCVLPRYMTTGKGEGDVMISKPLSGSYISTDIPDKVGYVYIKRTSTEESDDIFMSPYKLRKEINRKLPVSELTKLLKGMFDTLYAQHHDVTGSSQITNASVEMEFSSTDGPIYSMDMVPAFHVPEWPTIAKEWLTRERRWPCSTDVTKISEKGCHFVPKSSPGGDKHKEWRYSFSKTELELVKAQSGNQRRIYILFKLIFYAYIKQEKTDDKESTSDHQLYVNQHKLHSYSAKTTFMWYCEQHPPGEAIWRDENIQFALKELVRLFLAFLRSGVLPNYFLRSQNIIENVSADLLQDSVGRTENILDNWDYILAELTTDMLPDGVTRAETFINYLEVNTPGVTDDVLQNAEQRVNEMLDHWAETITDMTDNVVQNVALRANHIVDNSENITELTTNVCQLAGDVTRNVVEESIGIAEQVANWFQPFIPRRSSNGDT